MKILLKKDMAKILTTLDALAMMLPDGFLWPVELRKDYEHSVRLLTSGSGTESRGPSGL